jgi:hypothetical protein
MRENIIAIICPDIHGRNFWEKAANEYDGSVPFIFLGDYVDTYAHEGISDKACKENFNNIWEFKEKWGDNVILLLGNHDMSYYDKHFKCARYSSYTAEWYQPFLSENIESFKIAHQIINNGEKIIFSHAGIHPDWLSQNYFEQNIDADYIDSIFKKDKSYFNVYSRYRGGEFWDTGSPIWADIREYVKFENNKQEPINMPEGIMQIVGHTMLSTTMININQVYCIDSQQPFVLTNENKLEVY